MRLPAHLLRPRRTLVARAFTSGKPFATARIQAGKFLIPHQARAAMKSIVPVFLALIPLAAVVGACVAVP